jgi:hypothetical protein
MEAFDFSSPLSPAELGEHPIGALSVLATIASGICAEHGVDAARNLFVRLASSDVFWMQLRERFEPAEPDPEEGEPDEPAYDDEIDLPSIEDKIRLVTNGRPMVE